MIEDQLQGLILPLPENGFSPVLWLGLFLIVTLLGLALWRWKKSQTSTLLIARKALETLIKTSSPDKDKQATAIKCSQILSAGFGVKHLDQYHPADTSQWEKFYKKLNDLCYSNESNGELYSLLKEAKYFLSDKNVVNQ